MEYSSLRTSSLLSVTILFLQHLNSCMASHYIYRSDILHFHFYMHDDYTSPNRTAMRVLTVPSQIHSSSPRHFGDIVVLNNVITEGPSPDSKLVGRAQGFAVRVSEQGIVSDLSLHFVFEEGPYKGSSLTVHGRIATTLPVRESVVVGGTGQFRFARGYLLSKNYDYSLATGGTVEMDLYVLEKMCL